MIKTGTFPHQVFWEEPKFHDNVDSINQLKVVSTHENGVKFSKGRHTIIVTARDRATNTANCTFDIELESKLNRQMLIAELLEALHYTIKEETLLSVHLNRIEYYKS